MVVRQLAAVPPGLVVGSVAACARLVASGTGGQAVRVVNG